MGFGGMGLEEVGGDAPTLALPRWGREYGFGNGVWGCAIGGGWGDAPTLALPRWGREYGFGNGVWGYGFREGWGDAPTLTLPRWGRVRVGFSGGGGLVGLEDLLVLGYLGGGGFALGFGRVFGVAGFG